MESKYERIKNAIKESGKLIYWYKESGELLIVDSSKKASRKKLLNSKYEGYLYRFSFTFHTGKKYMQGGPLAVHVRHFKMEDNKILAIRDDQNGVVWFDKEWLVAQRRWDNEWFDVMIIKLNKGYKFGIGLYIYPI